MRSCKTKYFRVGCSNGSSPTYFKCDFARLTCFVQSRNEGSSTWFELVRTSIWVGLKFMAMLYVLSTHTHLHVLFQFLNNNRPMLFLNIYIPAKKSELTLKYTNKYVCTFIREKIFVISANCHIRLCKM
jgi:hypothetical protein